MEPIFLRGKMVVTDCNMNEACDDAQKVEKESLQELESLPHNAKEGPKFDVSGLSNWRHPFFGGSEAHPRVSLSVGGK